MRRPPRGVVTAACVLILALAAAEVRLPMYVERPLEPLELADVLAVDGRTAAELDGAYLVALVGRRRATGLSAAVALARDDERLRSAGEVIPPDVDGDAYPRRRREMFARSVEEAGAAALAALGRPVAQRTGGVAVVDVVSGSPADGRIRPGDVIVALDAQPTPSPSELREAVATADGRVAVTVERGDGERVVTLQPAPLEATGEQHVALGVVATPAEPRVRLPIEIALGDADTGGPSAGLIVALAVLDLIDDDRALAAGRRVAGTGRIGVDGRVRSVSAVPTKVRGAVAAGAAVFLVPQSQQGQAERTAGGRLEVIGVRDLGEAVDALGG